MSACSPIEYTSICVGEGKLYGLEVCAARKRGSAAKEAMLREQAVVERYLGEAGCRLPLVKNAQLENRLCAYSALRRLLERRNRNGMWQQVRKGLLSGGDVEVWFNISYTRGLGIAAVADVPVGIDVQVVRRMRDCVFSGICSEVEYGVHNAGNARDRCQLFSLKESYEKAKNDIGMVWPSDYAEYDARFSLKKGDQRALLSCCLPVAHAEYVASVTLLASPLRNI